MAHNKRQTLNIDNSGLSMIKLMKLGDSQWL